MSNDLSIEIFPPLFEIGRYDNDNINRFLPILTYNHSARAKWSDAFHVNTKADENSTAFHGPLAYMSTKEGSDEPFTTLLNKALDSYFSQFEASARLVPAIASWKPPRDVMEQYCRQAGEVLDQIPLLSITDAFDRVKMLRKELGIDEMIGEGMRRSIAVSQDESDLWQHMIERRFSSAENLLTDNPDAALERDRLGMQPLSRLLNSKDELTTQKYVGRSLRSVMGIDEYEDLVKMLTDATIKALRRSEKPTEIDPPIEEALNERLCECIKRNWNKKAKALCETGMSLQSALHFALKHQKHDMCDFLLEYGADVTDADEIMLDMVKHKHVSAYYAGFNWILERGYKPKGEKDGNIVLDALTHFNDDIMPIEKFTQLLERGFNPASQGMSMAVSRLAGQNEVDHLNALLDLGVSLDYAVRISDTNMSVRRLFLDRIVGDVFKNPLGNAIISLSADTIEALIGKGLDPNSAVIDRSPPGDFVIHALDAVETNDLRDPEACARAIRILAPYVPLDLWTRDTEKTESLPHRLVTSSMLSSPDVFQALVDIGVDLNMKNREGESVLDNIKIFNEGMYREISSYVESRSLKQTAKQSRKHRNDDTSLSL